MEEALKAVEAEIKGDGGQVNVKMMPKTVSETEDKELERLLERMGEENAEVAGDDDDSEGEA